MKSLQPSDLDRKAVEPNDPFLNRIVEFWRICDRLAAEGHCDGSGGGKTRRVFDERIGAGSPPEIAELIQWAANRFPEEERDWRVVRARLHAAPDPVDGGAA